jgi:hypothetical protein
VASAERRIARPATGRGPAPSPRRQCGRQTETISNTANCAALPKRGHRAGLAETALSHNPSRNQRREKTQPHRVPRQARVEIAVGESFGRSSVAERRTTAPVGTTVRGVVGWAGDRSVSGQAATLGSASRFVHSTTIGATCIAFPGIGVAERDDRLDGCLPSLLTPFLSPIVTGAGSGRSRFWPRGKKCSHNREDLCAAAHRVQTRDSPRSAP